MIKSSNITRYEILSTKELIENKLSYTVIPNNLEDLIKKYDSTHFAIMYHCLKFSNSDSHIISIENISKSLNIGQEKVGKVLKNLIKEGYLKREPYFESGRRKGFIYTVFNVLDSRSNEDCNDESRNSENQGANNNSIFKNNNKNNNNGLFVGDGCEKDFSNSYSVEKELDKVYKSEKSSSNNSNDNKLQKVLDSFTNNNLFLKPAISNLIKKYLNFFDTDLFDKIFNNISNNSKGVNNLLNYLSKTFKSLTEKNIKTLDDYLYDQEVYFGVKKENSKNNENSSNNNYAKNKGIATVHTRHHDIEQSYREYTEEQLEDMFRTNKNVKLDDFSDVDFNDDKALISMDWSRLRKLSFRQELWDKLSYEVKKFIIDTCEKENYFKLSHFVL